MHEVILPYYCKYEWSHEETEESPNAILCQDRLQGLNTVGNKLWL